MSAPPLPSTTHLVLLPSYNAGPRMLETVKAALDCWQPVWVVVDGSTDGSDGPLGELQRSFPGLRVLRHPTNRGKGAAVLTGMQAARAAAFQFALVMDADGQHPVARIREFMRLSLENPTAMILGVPEFGPDAPFARREGRRLGNWCANLETLWGGIQDSLFGFRVYPIPASLEVLENISGGRGYDFDTEVAVRLYWRGVRPINFRVPVRYYSRTDGHASHFHYVRDNLGLAKAHAILLLGMVARCRSIWRLRRGKGRDDDRRG